MSSAISGRQDVAAETAVATETTVLPNPIASLITLNFVVWTGAIHHIYSNIDYANTKEFIEKNKSREKAALIYLNNTIKVYGAKAGLTEQEIDKLIDLEGRSLSLSQEERARLFNLQRKLQGGVSTGDESKEFKTQGGVPFKTKMVTNSAGESVQRRLVSNEDDLLKIAEEYSGGSLDNLTEYKPNWYQGTVNGELVKIEYQPGGEEVMGEGPHVKIQRWDPTKDKKGKWVTESKYFIEGQETYTP